MSRPLYGARVEERSLRARLTTVRTEPAVCYGLMALLIAALVALGLALGHFTDFYSIDGDIKFLAALSIAHHPLNPAIPYPFHRLDPSGRFTLPLTAWYNGHDYAGYSLPFEYIAALFLKLFGSAGLIAPSIAATGLLLLVQFHLARLAGIRGHRGPLLLATVLATPLLFYALSFWEHAWGVALFLAGLTVLLHQARQNQPRIWVGLPAGLLYLGAILMRRDMAIPAIVSLLVLAAFYRDRRFLALVSTAGLTLCLPAAAIILLHPQPLALGLTHASPGRAPIAGGATASKLHRLQWLSYGGFATGLLILTSGVVLVTRLWKPRLLGLAIALCSVAVAAAYTVYLFGHFTYAAENPLPYCPIALWGVWSIFQVKRSNGEGRAHVILSLTACLGVVGIVLAASDYGGPQWGPRYLLFVFPLLILLAFRLRQELRSEEVGPVARRAAEYAFIALLALSCLIQMGGILSMAVSKREVGQVQRLVSHASPSVVVAADPSINSLAPLQPRKRLLFAGNPPEMAGVLRLLTESHLRAFVLVCGPGHHCPWNLSGWHHGPIDRRDRHILSFAVYRRT